MSTLLDISNNFKSGQDSYNIPEMMPAKVVSQNTIGSLKLEDVSVPVPEIGPDEALIAVMSGGINYNTVWTALGKPVSTFNFLKRLSLSSNPRSSHNLDYVKILGLTIMIVFLKN